MLNIYILHIKYKPTTASIIFFILVILVVLSNRSELYHLSNKVFIENIRKYNFE